MDVIDIILRKHNYSIMKVKKDILYIIKNEHGTYGEFNDFILADIIPGEGVSP